MNRAFYFYGANHREQYSPRTALRNAARIHSQRRESDTHCAPPPHHHAHPPTLGGGERKTPQTLHAAANWQLVQKCYFPKSRIAAPVGFLPGRGEEVVAGEGEREGEGGVEGAPSEKFHRERFVY